MTQMDSIVGELRGDRVKKRRDGLQLTQEGLGKLLGSDARTIWRYEKGRSKNPDFVVVQELAKHLETNTSYLLGLSDDDTPEMREEDLSPDERSIVVELRRDPELRDAVLTLVRRRR